MCSLLLHVKDLIVPISVLFVVPSSSNQLCDIHVYEGYRSVTLPGDCVVPYSG